MCELDWEAWTSGSGSGQKWVKGWVKWYREGEKQQIIVLVQCMFENLFEFSHFFKNKKLKKGEFWNLKCDFIHFKSQNKNTN